jgi:tRNA(adenine34) deaminase
MQQAITEAQNAYNEDEVPIGAVIVYKKSKIIARSHNQVERLKDPTAHAEILAITQAVNFLGIKFLDNCTIYVTIEPCCMCAGALVLARVEKIVFGASDPKTGAFGSKLDINTLRLNHKIKVVRGVLEKECSKIMKEFFKTKRKPLIPFSHN